MNPAHKDRDPLPRYGVGDDDKTRPCVVLFDWNDDEATVRVDPLELRAALATPPPEDGPEEDEEFELIDDDEVEELEELDVVEELDDMELRRLFSPPWPGVGRRPGAVALAVVLGVSFTIGAFALLGPGEAQAEAANAGAAVAR